MNGIPNLVFRIEPGYTFEQELIAPEFKSKNILVGQTNEEVSSIFIGKIAEYTRNLNIWLDYEGAHAIYVMGKRRSGKTYTLGVLIEGLASENWIKQGEKKQGILVLDTMNVFSTIPFNIDEISKDNSKELEVFKMWNLVSEKFNYVLFYPKGTDKPPEGISKEVTIKPKDLDDKDWAALFGFDTYSDPMGQLISDVFEKVVLNGYLDVNGKKINKNEDYSIEDLLECLSFCSEIQESYNNDTIRAVVRRLKAINRQSVISKTGIEIQELFKPGQISIILLRDLDQNLRSLLVGIMIKKIMMLRSKSDKFERLSSVYKHKYEILKEKSGENNVKEIERKYKEYVEKSQKGLPRGWIIIDEAHNYMPTKTITPSTEPLKKYVNEGRNLGLSIVMATQNPSALDLSIRRNADILIIHSISMKNDINAAEGMINTFFPESFGFGKKDISNRVFEQLIRSLPKGYAVISNDGINRIFVAKIRPRITVHGGKEY